MWFHTEEFGCNRGKKLFLILNYVTPVQPIEIAWVKSEGGKIIQLKPSVSILQWTISDYSTGVHN